MDRTIASCCALLGIDATLDMKKIRAAWLLRVRMFHPDQYKSEEDKIQANDVMVEMNVCYDFLKRAVPEKIRSIKAVEANSVRHVNSVEVPQASEYRPSPKEVSSIILEMFSEVIKAVVSDMVFAMFWGVVVIVSLRMVGSTLEFIDIASFDTLLTLEGAVRLVMLFTIPVSISKFIKYL